MLPVFLGFCIKNIPTSKCLSFRDIRPAYVFQVFSVLYDLIVYKITCVVIKLICVPVFILEFKCGAKSRVRSNFNHSINRELAGSKFIRTAGDTRSNGFYGAAIFDVENVVRGVCLHAGDCDTDREDRLDLGTGVHIKEGEVNSCDALSLQPADGIADVGCGEDGPAEHYIFRQGSFGRDNRKGDAVVGCNTLQIADVGIDCFKGHVSGDNGARLCIDIGSAIEPAVDCSAAGSRHSADGSAGSDLAGFNRLAVGCEGNGIK